MCLLAKVKNLQESNSSHILLQSSMSETRMEDSTKIWFSSPHGDSRVVGVPANGGGRARFLCLNCGCISVMFDPVTCTSLPAITILEGDRVVLKRSLRPLTDNKTTTKTTAMSKYLN